MPRFSKVREDNSNLPKLDIGQMLPPLPPSRAMQLLTP